MAEAYLLTSLSRKQYVGVTSTTAARRWESHCKDARSGRYPRNALYRSIRKYGASSFSVETLVVGTWEYVLELEDQLIRVYETMRPVGYNAKHGGSGGRMAEETRRQMSVSQRRRMKDPRQRKLFRKQQLEIWQRPGYREKMSAIHRARKRDPVVEVRRLTAFAKTARTEAYRKAQSIRMTRWWAERRDGGLCHRS